VPAPRRKLPRRATASGVVRALPARGHRKQATERALYERVVSQLGENKVRRLEGREPVPP
jgi:hypothetical protein